MDLHPQYDLQAKLVSSQRLKNSLNKISVGSDSPAEIFSSFGMVHWIYGWKKEKSQELILHFVWVALILSKKIGS